MKKLSPARRLGLYPETSVGLSGLQRRVEVRIERGLCDWFLRAARRGDIMNIEETVFLALRAMRGDGDNLNGLVRKASQTRNVSPVEVMFGKVDKQGEEECHRLLTAALIAAEFNRSPVWSASEIMSLPDDRRTELIRVWQAAAPGRNIQADIDAAQVEWERMVTETDDPCDDCVESEEPVDRVGGEPSPI